MSGPETIRAFVALDLPETVRDVIRREQNAIKPVLPRARWTRPEGQHLTLKFLGEIDRRQLRMLTENLTTELAGAGAVEIRFGGAGFFPNPRRPRVAWIGGEADGGLEAAESVDRAAVAAGFDPERRPWSLHLTQARLGRPWPRTAVEAYLDWGRGVSIEPFVCREVVLFESDLQPGGAVYTALERFPLE